MKNSSDTIGTRNGNIPLVAQCLNQMETRVPHPVLCTYNKSMVISIYFRRQFTAFNKFYEVTCFGLYDHRQLCDLRSSTT